MGFHLRFFLDLLCAKPFFGPFLCGGTSQKNLGSVGAGVRRMGSHLTWPHGSPVSKAFFGPFLCAKAFFGPFLCFWAIFVWWDVPKKTLAVGGQVFRFLVRLFFRPFWNSALSDVWVPV